MTKSSSKAEEIFKRTMGVSLAGEKEGYVAATKEKVLEREWLLNTTLDDFIGDRILEYSWHSDSGPHCRPNRSHPLTSRSYLRQLSSAGRLCTAPPLENITATSLI